jgi:hypothetical protein
LVKLAAELEQRAPERDVVGHGGGPADGAKQNGVHALQLRLPVGRHHLAVSRIPVATGPLDGRELQRDAETLGRRLQHAQALGHHFLADAVAGDDGNAMCVRHGGRRLGVEGGAVILERAAHGRAVDTTDIAHTRSPRTGPDMPRDSSHDLS